MKHRPKHLHLQDIEKAEMEMMAEMSEMMGESPSAIDGWEKMDSDIENKITDQPKAETADIETEEIIDTESKQSVAAKEIETKERSQKIEPSTEKKKDPQAISSIRVSTQQLDSLIELVGKLMVTYAVIAQTKTDNISRISSSLTEMDKDIRNLQSEMDEIRLVPLKQIFMPMHRLVKSTSQKLT